MYDRVFSFLTDRTCTLFFYFSRASGYETDRRPAIWSLLPDPEEGLYHTCIQHVIRLLKNLVLDQMGNIVTVNIILHNAVGLGPEPSRLEIRQTDPGLRNFTLVQELVQGHMIYVPVTFSAPALSVELPKLPLYSTLRLDVRMLAHCCQSMTLCLTPCYCTPCPVCALSLPIDSKTEIGCSKKLHQPTMLWFDPNPIEKVHRTVLLPACTVVSFRSLSKCQGRRHVPRSQVS